MLQFGYPVGRALPQPCHQWTHVLANAHTTQLWQQHQAKRREGAITQQGRLGTLSWRSSTVRDHLVWVHNVVLIECIFGSGKPQGVGILGKGSTWATGNTKGGQFTSNREQRWTDPVTARRVPSKGTRGSTVYIWWTVPRIRNRMHAMNEWYQLCVYV